MGVVSSTDVVQPSERFAYWREVVCKHFVHAESWVRTDQGFDATMLATSLGRFEFGLFQAPLHNWSRTARHIRHDECDDILLSLVLDGECKLSQNGRVVRQSPGDLIIYDAARSFQYEMSGRTIVFRFSRNALFSSLPIAESLCAVRLGVDSPIREALTSTLRVGASNTEVFEADPVAGAHFGSAIVKLLLSLLEIESSGLPKSLASSQFDRFERAKRYAMANLGDGSLTCEKLSEHAGVSLSTLNRLFGAIGTTPMRWVWKQRANAARDVLVNGRASSVTDAGLSCGYTELSHFSRSFKAAFGVTPQSLLDQCRSDERRASK